MRMKKQASRVQHRERRFGHKVYLSDAEEVRIGKYSQDRGIPMGQIMRNGALALIERDPGYEEWRDQQYGEVSGP